MILQAAGLITVVSFWFCAILFPVAHCAFLIAFCSDLRNELDTFDESLKIKGDKETFFSMNPRKKINEKLFKIIQFQCDAKQLSESKYTFH